MRVSLIFFDEMYYLKDNLSFVRILLKLPLFNKQYANWKLDETLKRRRGSN